MGKSKLAALTLDRLDLDEAFDGESFSLGRDVGAVDC